MEAATTTIKYDDFARLELRVATVIECKPVPKSNKLLVLQIELGNGERRQILAGIGKAYQSEQLIGKQVVVVANLEPATIFGETSQGMLLAASDASTGQVIVISPSEPIAPGSQVK